MGTLPGLTPLQKQRLVDAVLELPRRPFPLPYCKRGAFYTLKPKDASGGRRRRR